MPSDSAAKGTRRPIRIGKYEVLAHIATGGMGAVYKAKDVELEREVALKVLTPEMAANANLLERFRREARHAARLNHENIVTLYEFGESHGTYFLAMEFVDGIDLHEYIKRKGPLDPEETRHIILQAARALEHAHQQKIVHRDIKPSNFLVTRKDGELLIKLTDMGLAQRSHDKEARVTRHGNTVGTVDYIAPEQAKDSSSADTRSDIYSLGCTWYHMLTGKAPFPEGSLAERIYKHIEAEPPDVRQFNPKVSEAMVAVLRRMMAKDPDDRYQTPAELLKDLERGGPTRSPAVRSKEAIAERDVLASLAHGDEEAETPRSRTKTDVRQRTPALGPRHREDGQTAPNKPAPAKQNAWLWIAGGTAVLLVAVIIIVVLTNRSTPRPTPPDETNVVQNPPGDPGRKPEPEPDSKKKEDPPFKKPDPEPVKRRWLYPGAEMVDPVPVGRDIEAPWAKDAPPAADTPVFRVSRSFQRQQADGPDFESLVGAWNAARPNQLTLIEIHDNGPLFLPPLAVKDRSLVLRAGKGYRPLLVWDLGAAQPMESTPATAFLSLAQGHLTLENLDVVLQRPNSGAAEPVALAHVAEGDFLARGCTFSVAGKHRAGVVLVRLESKATETGTRKEGRRCRLSHCFARGANLIALDLRTAGAEVLLDHCLIVGGDQPLLQVAGRNEPPVTLRVARSTLVAGQTLLQVKPASTDDGRPALRWLSWDTLLARSGESAVSELVALKGNAGPGAMQWRAVNCYYAGWKTLLAGPEPISSGDHAAWQRRWLLNEGDAVTVSPWPAAVVHDPAEIAAGEYRTADTPAGFAATSGTGTLGCDVTALPPSRDNWLALTYERFPMVPLELLARASPPEIPLLNDGRFHGERLDLNKIDLGAFLQEKQKTSRLGPRVVLRLTGSGERRTSPVRVKGSSLVLYFEPAEGEPASPPLVLIPSERLPANQSALIDVEAGDLEIVGGEIRLPNSKVALVPHHLLRVRGGDLRLHGCRLQGPLGQMPLAYRGLIDFEGSGDATPDQAQGCAINESILLSGKTGLHLAGGGVRLRLRQSVIVAGSDAVHFEPGAAAQARLNVQCLLENNTVAVRGALLRLSDAPHLAVPAEPVIVQARANVFLDPFTESHRAGLLLGEKAALGRGLLIWQGDGNVYDKRLHYYVAVAEAIPDRQQAYAAWSSLWGTAGDRQPVLDLPVKLTLDLDRPQLDRLALPQPNRLKPPLPGADLKLLGLLRKPKN